MTKPQSYLLLPIFILNAWMSPTQNDVYRSLLEKVINTPQIIAKKPLSNFKLDLKNIGRYEDFLKAQGKGILDTNLLKEMISKTLAPDTSDWSQLDFKRAILVDNYTQDLNYDSAISTLKRSRRKAPDAFKALIKEYNLASKDDYSHNPRISKVGYYSRPIFDQTGNFALVAFYLPRQQFAVYVYHLEEKEWKLKGKLFALSF